MIQFPLEWMDDVNTIRQEMRRLLDHFAGSKPPMIRFSPTVWEPVIDLYETDDEIVLTVELAGVNESDFQMLVDRNVFIIRGERRKALPAGKSGVYHQMEISSGPFERSIPLPESVDADRARASYKNGLVEVVLPKFRKERTIRVVEIDVK